MLIIIRCCHSLLASIFSSFDWFWVSFLCRCHLANVVCTKSDVIKIDENRNSFRLQSIERRKLTTKSFAVNKHQQSHLTNTTNKMFNTPHKHKSNNKIIANNTNVTIYCSYAINSKHLLSYTL